MRLNDSLKLAVAVSLVTLAVYLPTLRNDFVLWDDNVIVYENIHIRALTPDFFKWALSTAGQNLWEPLTWVSYAFDYALWGLRPAGYHLTNLLLHTANTFIVVCLIIKIIGASNRTAPSSASSEPGIGALGTLNERAILIAAGVTGVLFGIHPMHVEPVAWTTGRNDLLCALFFLLSTYAYAAYVAGRGADAVLKVSPPFYFNTQYLMALAFFGLSLASKPLSITLPVVLLVLDGYPFHRMSSWKKVASLLIEKIPFFVVGIIISIVTFTAQKAVGSVDTLEDTPFAIRILVAAKAVVLYLWKMTMPLHLLPFYAYPEKAEVLSFEYFSAVMLIFCLTAACTLRIRKQPVVLTAWLYFILVLLPVIGLIKAREVFMADRYVYLPSLGPFFLIGLLISGVWAKADLLQQRAPALRSIMLAVALCLVFFLSFLSVKQIGIWKNSIDLWSYVIKEEPVRVPIAYLNRGLAFEGLGSLDRATEDFSAAIALKPGPRYVYLAYNNRGVTLTEAGRLRQGLEDLNTAIALEPSRHLAYCNRGLVFGKIGQFEQAIEDFDRAIELDPSYVDSYVGRGLALERTGRFDRAIEDFDKAIALNPYNADAYLNRGVTFVRLDRPDMALADYDKAIALNPSDYLAYYNRGIVYGKMGRFEKAIADYTMVISMKPDFEQAYMDRGNLYLKTGSRGPAFRDFRKACGLGSEGGCLAARNGAPLPEELP